MQNLDEKFERMAAWLARRLLPPVIEAGAMPWMSLLYLTFLLLPLLIPDMAPPDWALTALSVVLFLPMYFYFYWSRGWRRVGILVAMAALCAALLPANPFANSFLIYSSVLAAFLPWKMMVGVFLIAEAFMVAAIIGMNLDAETARLMMIVTALPGGLAMICQKFWIASAKRNQVLRLTQDEVQRLARVAERERISRDLHDLLGHTLSVVALKAELASKLFHRDPESAAREIADVERVAREALGQVRRAVSGMRALGLRAELANARLAMAAVEVDFEYRADDLSLHPELETVLALSLREATTNIIRHASARRCRCELGRDGDRVTMMIRDDGIGGAKVAGNGLKGMRERIESLDGTLAIESGTGIGTQLSLSLPYRSSAALESTPTAQPPRLAVVG